MSRRGEECFGRECLRFKSAALFCFGRSEEEAHAVPPLGISFRETGNILRKAVCFRTPLDESNELSNIKGGVTSGSSSMSSSSSTKTSRMAGARYPDIEFDLGVIVKQQQIARDLPLPSITASQISTCENALKELKLKAKGNGGRNLNGAIDCEFDTLQAEAMHNYKALSLSQTVALAPSNRTKNRYVDVLPYDSTRVVLGKKHSACPYSDYINASFVQDNAHGYLPRYIATQGPLPTTVSDLWTMVLQQRCPVVIMLTRIVDGDQAKCAHYFPKDENQSQRHGQILVTNKSCICSPHGIARRIFTVQDIKCPEQPWTVVHYEYLEWLDCCVPSSTRSVRELIRATFCIPPQAGPFVVHCSAGIGRTGTYCAIEHTLRRILGGDLSAVDIENTVRQFRSQRDRMVETREQYRFCYEAVIQELEDYISTAK